VRREAIGIEAPTGRRLQDDRWRRGIDVVHDGLSPTAVVWKLEHITRDVEPFFAGARRDPCSRFRFDVAAKECARARVMGSAHHQRQVIVMRRPKMRIGPDEVPCHLPNAHRVSRRYLTHPHTHSFHTVYERIDRWHAPSGVNKRRVHNQLTHPRIPRYIKQRAEVVKIWMRDDYRVDLVGALTADHWKQGTRGNASR
jgi:hypothetical protein